MEPNANQESTTDLVLSPEDSSEPLATATLSPEEAKQWIRDGRLIENVRIERLNFTGEISGAVRMRRVMLIRPKFENADFQDDVSFQACTIDRPMFSRKNVFRKTLSMSGCTLTGVNMLGVEVAGLWNCSNIKTKGPFRVNQCIFRSDAKFWEANFRGWSDFKKCEFHGQVDFRSVTASEGFVLNQCKFAGDVLLRGAAVAKKFDAHQSRFEKLVDFSKAKLNDYVYLENVEQGDQQRWAFWNVVGERLQIRCEQLKGRILSEEKGEFEKAMHEYAFLKKTFSNLHRYEQEDWAFYHFKVNQRRSAKRSWAKPWTKLSQFFDWCLLDQGCGYCTNPNRAVRTAIVILLGFALIYFLGFSQFHVDKVPFPDLEKDAWPNRVVISLVTSVAAFTSGLSGIKDVAKGWMNIPLMIEALLGTLLFGLFIVAFSRKVIR